MDFMEQETLVNPDIVVVIRNYVRNIREMFGCGEICGLETKYEIIETKRTCKVF